MLPDINLLPQYERKRSFSYIFFIVALIVIVFSSGLVIYQYISITKEIDTIRKQNDVMVEEKERLELEYASLKDNQTSTLEQSIEYVQSMLLPTSILIDELFTKLPETGYISHYTYNHGKIEIESQFETISDTAEYVAALVATSYLQNVQVDQVNTFELSEPQAEGEEEESPERKYKEIPRYHTIYSFAVNRQLFLKEDNANE